MLTVTEKILLELISVRAEVKKKRWTGYHVTTRKSGWNYFTRYDEMLFFLVSIFLSNDEIQDTMIVYGLTTEQTFTYKDFIKQFKDPK